MNEEGDAADESAVEWPRRTNETDYRLGMRLTLCLLLVACGSASPESEHPQGHHHAHGHHHDHTSPEALQPLMHDLQGWMSELKQALDAEDVEAAATPARAIAVACDDHDVHAFDPELFGPQFGEIDERLHSGAAEMSNAAEAGDLDGARGHYSALYQACVDCHAQAPTAGAVSVDMLAP